MRAYDIILFQFDRKKKTEAKFIETNAALGAALGTGSQFIEAGQKNQALHALASHINLYNKNCQEIIAANQPQFQMKALQFPWSHF